MRGSTQWKVKKGARISPILRKGVCWTWFTKIKDKVENKRTDTDANRLKKEAWKEIEKRFNSDGLETYRSELILKRKYENIEKRTKAKFADEKKYTLGTGGGPAKSASVTDTDEIIKEIIGDQLTGRPSKFDSDTMVEDIEMESSVANLSAEINATLPLFEEMEELTGRTHFSDGAEPSTAQVCSSIQNDWSSYSPAKLRMPKSTPLVTKKVCAKGVSLNNKLTNWAHNKVEIDNLKKDQLIEEQKLHLEFLRESYKLNLDEQKERLKQGRERHELFVQESNLRMNIMREEHEKKMEILRMKNNQS